MKAKVKFSYKITSSKGGQPEKNGRKGALGRKQGGASVLWGLNKDSGMTLALDRGVGNEFGEVRTRWCPE